MIVVVRAALDNVITAARECVCETSGHSWVEWAPDAAWSAVEDMRVDHRGAHVLVAEQLLDRSNVITVLE